MSITKLRDAKTNKAMGLPLNREIRDRDASPIVIEHWGALRDRTLEMMAATSKWLNEVQLGLPHDKSWARLNRRIQKLSKVLVEAHQAVNRMAGIPIHIVEYNEEQGVKLVKALEKDPSSVILVVGLLPRVCDYLNFWQEFVNEVAQSKPGDSLDVAHLLDAPKVFDDE